VSVKVITDKLAPALASPFDREAWPTLAATPPPAEFILRGGDGKRTRGLYAAASADRVCAALTWNVFHTLRLIAPAFWMRRLRARLAGLDGLDHVPLAATITLWEPRIPAVPAFGPPDVFIETDHVVMALLTLYRRDWDRPTRAGAPFDPIGEVVNTVTTHAGVRDCYVGLVTTDGADSPRAVEAVERHAGLRVRVGPPPVAREGITKLGVGWTTWGDLAAILQDAARAAALDRLERDAARRTARWLASVGVTPTR
jgi:hypothetical protein